MKFLYVILCLPIVSGKPHHLEMRSACSTDNRDNCLKDWGCMWCNDTMKCTEFRVCDFNKSILETCEISDYNYESQCDFFDWLFFCLIIFAFASAVFFLLYTNRKVLESNSTNNILINRIQLLLTSLIVIPYILLYFFDSMTFYYYLFTIILFSLLYGCCFSSSRRVRDYRHNIRNPEEEKLLN